MRTGFELPKLPATNPALSTLDSSLEQRSFYCNKRYRNDSVEVIRRVQNLCSWGRGDMSGSCYTEDVRQLPTWRWGSGYNVML